MGMNNFRGGGFNGGRGSFRGCTEDANWLSSTDEFTIFFLF